MDKVQELIAEWVREVRTQAGLSQADLGAQLALELGEERGHTKANISHWETRKHSPNLKQLMAIAKITSRGLPPEVTGAFANAKPLSDEELATLAPDARWVADIEEQRDFIEIPLVKLTASAGITGFLTETEHDDGSKVRIPLTWLYEKKLRSSELVAIKVRGESMEPSLHNGDTVIVNTADRKPADGAVFVINHEGEVIIKRVEKRGARWYLASDNQAPRYGARIVHDPSTVIIGRVVRKESDYI